MICQFARLCVVKKKAHEAEDPKSVREAKEASEPESPLRLEQRELAKKFILEAVAEEINRGKGDGISMSEVAVRARVSLRTLYRYFPTKDALIDAFWVQYIGTVPAFVDEPVPAEQFADWVKGLFASFEANREIFKALLTMGPGRDVRAATMHRRRRMISKSLEKTTTALDPETVKRLHALIHALCSVGVWQSMSDNWGVSGKESGSVSAWAIELVLKEIATRPDSLTEFMRGKGIP